MTNIISELSRPSSFLSLRSHDNSASALNNSVYNLDSSSYEIMRFTNSSPTSSTASSPTASTASSPTSSTTSSTASSAALSYSHHIKFNNSKFNEELNQIENQLKNMSNFVSKIPLFEEESKSNIFSS